MVQIKHHASRKFAGLALLLGFSTMFGGCAVTPSAADTPPVADTGSGGGADTTEVAEAGEQNWVQGASTSSDCSGEQTLTGIRAGRHDGFDRIVFDLDGVSTPCFDITFESDPIQAGSGNPVDVGGYHALRVELTNLGPEFPTVEPGYSVPLNGTYVNQAFFDTFFEGTATNFIAVVGADGEYSVEALPGKLIVDVR